jgi:hypothetical protein
MNHFQRLGSVLFLVVSLPFLALLFCSCSSSSGFTAIATNDDGSLGENVKVMTCTFTYVDERLVEVFVEIEYTERLAAAKAGEAMSEILEGVQVRGQKLSYATREVTRFEGFNLTELAEIYSLMGFDVR